MVGWGGAGNPSSAQETVRGAHRWVGGGRCPEGVASFTTRDSGPGSQTPDVPRQTLRDLEALRLTHTCQAHPAWGMAQGQEGARPRPTRPLSGHRPLLGTQPWLLPPRFRGPRRVAGRPGVESLLCEFGLPPPHTTLFVNLCFICFTQGGARGPSWTHTRGALSWTGACDLGSLLFPLVCQTRIPGSEEGQLPGTWTWVGPGQAR